MVISPIKNGWILVATTFDMLISERTAYWSTVHFLLRSTACSVDAAQDSVFA